MKYQLSVMYGRIRLLTVLNMLAPTIELLLAIVYEILQLQPKRYLHNQRSAASSVYEDSVSH